MSSSPTFDLTWDYRCPWARKVHMHVLAGLQAGATWQVRFRPFVLGQSSIDENGGTDSWDDTSKAADILMLQAGVAVRDTQPNAMLAFHGNAYEAKHRELRDIRQEGVVRAVLIESGVDDDAIFDEILSGRSNATIKKEHRDAADRLGVFGVPTFMTENDSVYVRYMDDPDESNPAGSIEIIDRIIWQLINWPQLNEFKHSRVSR